MATGPDARRLVAILQACLRWDHQVVGWAHRLLAILAIRHRGIHHLAIRHLVIRQWAFPLVGRRRLTAGRCPRGRLAPLGQMGIHLQVHRRLAQTASRCQRCPGLAVRPCTDLRLQAGLVRHQVSAQVIRRQGIHRQEIGDRLVRKDILRDLQTPLGRRLLIGVHGARRRLGTLARRQVTNGRLALTASRRLAIQGLHRQATRGQGRRLRLRRTLRPRPRSRQGPEVAAGVPTARIATPTLFPQSAKRRSSRRS